MPIELPSATQPANRTAATLLCVLAFLPWLALAVAQVLDAWFLCDDAFICFRYARNLIEGHGLVFNRGERGGAIVSVSAPMWFAIR